MPVNPRSWRRTLPGLIVALVMGVTATASAVTRIVDDNKADCPEAAYTSIGAAIAAASSGDRIRVCAGVYPEQVVLTKSITIAGRIGLSGRPIIRPTTLGVTPASLIGPKAVRAGVVIDQTGASLRDVDIDLANVATPTCEPLAGVYYRAATGVLRGVNVMNVRVSGVPTCSSGVGIYVESGQTGVEDGAPVIGQSKVTVNGVNVSDTQKGGVVARGEQAIVKVRQCVFEGDGAAATVPQNGVEVSGGAHGRVGDSTFTGFGSPLADKVGAAILVYGSDRVVGREIVVEDTDVGAFVHGDRAKILTCQVDDAGSDGVIVLGDRNVMSGNVLAGATVSGVFINGASNRVRGGRISEMPVGIWFYGGEDNHASAVAFSNVTIPGQNVAGGPRAIVPETAMPFALGCQDASGCSDGLPCTTDVCDVLHGTCSSVANCNDGNPCTSDACTAGGCVATPLSGTACSDGNLCTISELCNAGVCVGQPVNCDDGSACTTDSCSPSSGCLYAPVSCNDSDACTKDTCVPATGCQHTPVVCADGSACTTDSCDSATGCKYTSITCNDGNLCTGDTCNPLVGCQTPPVVCNDQNSCTNDSCNSATGCTFGFNVNPCDDTNPCTANDVCGGGVCVGGASPCNDNNACTNAACDPASGCSYTAVNCDDANPCTADTCNPTLGCQHAGCDDGNACTTDACDPVTGCSHTAVNCNDANACTSDA
jgi:hypothetical protein